MKTTTLAFSAATLLITTCLPAGAQQTTGVPGSPDATTTIDGRYIPPPPQKFEGEINLNAAQSKPAWPARVVPPKGAPNILLILTDDVGFGAPSTFGGVIPTPALDQRAALPQFPLDLAVLADPGCADHRAQPPLGRVRCDLRDRDGLPGLQQRDRQGQRHDRSHSSG
jgi:hypothetical protein